MIPSTFANLTINDHDILAFPINGPSWSMFAEYIENIIYGIMARYLSGYYIIVALGLSAIIESVFICHYGTPNTGYMSKTIWLSLIRIQFPFICGISINYIYRLGYLNRIRCSSVIPPIVLVFMLTVSINISVLAFSLVSVFFVIPAIIVTGIAANHCQTNSSWFYSFLGKISYPLYVLHMPIMMFGIERMRLIESVVLRAVVFAGAMLALVIASYIAVIFYDGPVRRFLTAKYISKKAVRNSWISESGCRDLTV